MDFNVPIMSLENMAARNIASSLWLSSFCIKKTSEFDPEIFKKRSHDIMLRVEKLNLPDSLKKDICTFIRPVGFEIFRWLYDHINENTLDFVVTKESVNTLATKIQVVVTNMRSAVVLEERTLPFPTLQNYSIILVAKLLWTSRDIMKRIINWCQTFEEAGWNDINAVVSSNAKQLSIPSFLCKDFIIINETTISEDLHCLLEVISSRLYRWFLVHRYMEILNFDVNFPSLNYLSWTSVGTINRRRTAQKLVKIPSTPLSKRYRLACLYNLEDVGTLWEQLDPVDFYEKDLSMIQRQESFMTAYFTCQAANEVSRLENELIEGQTLQEYVISVVAKKIGCRNTFKTFWDRLQSNEKSRIIVRVAQEASATEHEKSTDVVLFLMEEMVPEVMTEFLRSNFDIILPRLLKFPYQSLFLKLYNLIVSTSVNAEFFHKILTKIVTNFDADNEDFLISFWVNSSNILREYIFQCNQRVLELIEFMLEMSYIRALKLIWNDVTVNENRNTMFVRISHSLIQKGKWYILNQLLPLCLETGDFAIPKYKRSMNDYAKMNMNNLSEDFKTWNLINRYTLLEYLYDNFKE